MYELLYSLLGWTQTTSYNQGDLYILNGAIVIVSILTVLIIDTMANLFRRIVRQ